MNAHSSTNPTTSLTARDWKQQLGDRWVKLWLLKMVGICSGMGLFFTAYFWVLNHPIHAIVTMPILGLDHWIAFRPAALPLYLSLWVYVCLIPSLAKDFRELARYGLAALVLSVLGLGIFLLWPTTVPVLDMDWTQYPSMAFLKTHDASGNACPSLHVAFAVLSAFWFEHIFRAIRAPIAIRLLNPLWCLGIVYSTLATRQHVALDALAGAALGVIVALSMLRSRP